MSSINTKDISLSQAQAVVAAAQAKAAEIGTKMDIAVVDAGANLKAFARMDGDTVIGAIGVSGSSVEDDHTVAQAGVDAIS